MAIKLAFLGATEHNNSKGLLFTMAFSGVYGTNGVGDDAAVTGGQATLLIELPLQ